MYSIIEQWNCILTKFWRKHFHHHIQTTLEADFDFDDDILEQITCIEQKENSLLKVANEVNQQLKATTTKWFENYKRKHRNGAFLVSIFWFRFIHIFRNFWIASNLFLSDVLWYIHINIVSKTHIVCSYTWHILFSHFCSIKICTNCRSIVSHCKMIPSSHWCIYLWRCQSIVSISENFKSFCVWWSCVLKIIQNSSNICWRRLIVASFWSIPSHSNSNESAICWWSIHQHFSTLRKSESQCVFCSSRRYWSISNFIWLIVNKWKIHHSIWIWLSSKVSLHRISLHNNYYVLY